MQELRVSCAAGLQQAGSFAAAHLTCGHISSMEEESEEVGEEKREKKETRRIPHQFGTQMGKEQQWSYLDHGVPLCPPRARVSPTPPTGSAWSWKSFWLLQENVENTGSPGMFP